MRPWAKATKVRAWLVQIPAETRVWTLAVVTGVVFSCVFLLRLDHLHRRELSDSMSMVQAARASRIDLAKAALLLAQTGLPGARPEDRARGLALLDQAVEMLAQSVNELDRPRRTSAGAEVSSAELRRIEATYRKFLAAGKRGAWDDLEQRLAHEELERFAARVDAVHRAWFAEKRATARAQFDWAVVGIVVMLMVLCLGVWSASRAERRARLRLREAAEAAGVDFLEEELGSGELRWWQGRATVLGEGCTVGTFDELVARAGEATDAARLQELRDEAAAGRRSEPREVRLQRGDGSECWVMATAGRHDSGSGAPRLIGGMLVDITERKREENARVALAMKFRQLFENVSVGLLFARRDGGLNAVNRRAHAMLGYSFDEMSPIERWWVRAFPDAAYRREVQERWARDVESAGTTGGEIPLREYRIRVKSGETRIFEFSGMVMGDELIIVIDDITDRRAAEEALRTHQAVLEETGRIAKVGGWSFDARTGKGYWTEEVAHIHDLDPAAQSSVEIGLSFYTEPSRRTIAAAIKAAVEEGRPYDLELELVSAKGVRKWVRTIGHPECEGGVVVRLRGSFQDITQMRRMQESLRESEERFREMAENVDEVFWMTDERGEKVLYVSPAFERIWGRPCQSVLENPEIWRESIHAADRPRIMALMGREIARGCAAEYRINRPDGSVRWVSDRAFPVRDVAGKVVRIVGAVRDITEHKRIEEQFLRAQRLEAVGTLASGVAHDLNNILAPVLMVCGLLRRKLANPADGKLLTLVENAAQRGAEIVSQMLTFSRGASGERMEVRIEHLASEIMRLLEETLPRNIRIMREFESDLPTVLADPTRLHQVLMNLCVNARDAMPEGGELVLGLRTSQVTGERAALHEGVSPGDFVVLSVADTGTGIPPEIRHRIFDPFFTTKEVGKGTGLGLATVLGIVRSHGGFVEVQSEPGRGARFDVHLPVARGGTVAPNGGTSPDEQSGAGETVLIVDDEESLRMTLRHALEISGYQVLEAGNGVEALAAVAKAGGKVDVVLSDVMMPEMGGWELVRRLREEAPQLPVVLCSGLEQDAPPDRLAALGVQGMLKKPYSLHALLKQLERVLHRGAGAAGG